MSASLNLKNISGKIIDFGKNSEEDMELSDEQKKEVVLAGQISGDDLRLLLSSVVDSHWSLSLCYEALKFEVLSPDLLLTIAPQERKNETCLPFVALALKFGADPNLYVKSPDSGSVHFIYYLSFLFDENPTKSSREFSWHPDRMSPKSLNAKNFNALDKILILLFLKGANINLPFKEPTNRRNPNEINVAKSLDFSGNASSSLLKQTNFDQERIIEFLGHSEFDEYRIALDIPMKGMMSPVTILRTCISYFSPNTFDLTIDSNEISTKDGQYLVSYAIRNYNMMAYGKLIDRGFLPNYHDINMMLTELRKVQRTDDDVTSSKLEKMITFAVELGVEMDKYQIDYLYKINPNIGRLVQDKYSVPHWRKVCSSPKGNSPQRLRRLASGFDLPLSHSKEFLCDELRKIDEAERDRFIESREDARRSYYLTQMGGNYNNDENGAKINLEDYQQAIVPDKRISNPESYNPLSMVFYRDDQGRPFFFVREQFDDLLSKKMNPYTQEKLPDNFVEEIRMKKNIYKDLGIEGDLDYLNKNLTMVPKTFSEAYDALDKPDEVTSDSDLYEFEKFKILASKNGISDYLIENLKTDQLQSSLPLAYKHFDLSLLENDSFARITTARIVNEMDSSSQRKFFEKVLSQVRKR